MGQYLFGKFRDEAGNYVRVEIHRLGVGGDNHEEVTIRGLKANLNGNPQEPYRPFSTTSGELMLSIHGDKFWQRRLVFDLLEAGDHGFGIHVYVSSRDDIGRRSIPRFIGFVDINNLTYDDYPFPYDLTLKFYDGLSSLRDIEFTTRWEPYKEGGIAWTRSVHNMIFDCINCIPNIEALFKNLDAPAVTVNCSWFADNMDLINGELDNPLEVTAVNPAKWNEIKNGGELGVFENAGKILEDLLSRFQLRMYFSGTTFVIEQISERRNSVVIRNSYKLDGSNYFGIFQPGRGEYHDIEVDRVDTHRVAKSGFGYFPAAKEVRVNFNYTNDFSWVHTGEEFKKDSDVDAEVGEWFASLITPKYNYDEENKCIAFRLKIKVKSDYLIPYINNSFSHRYVFGFKFMFDNKIIADEKYNNEYMETRISYGESRWLEVAWTGRTPTTPTKTTNPGNQDEIFWNNIYASQLIDVDAWISIPSQAISQGEWGEWQEVVIEGKTAPIPEGYDTLDYPVGVCFSLMGLVAQGSGFRTFYEDNINSYIDIPDKPNNEWWNGADGKPKIFRVQYEVEDFAIWLSDEDRKPITETVTRVYSGLVNEKNKKVIEVDTEFGDGPGPLSFSALRVLNPDGDWVLSEGWSYAGITGDIHELQVKELMRFYGEPRRMLTGKVWLRTTPDNVNGPPFIYRFLYDNGIFLPMQVTYDFQTNILDGKLMSVLGEYTGSAEVEVREYEGADAKLKLKTGQKGVNKITVDPAAGLGVVRTRSKIGIDSYANGGSTAMVTELKITPANYGYFNKGDQIQVTDGNTGRQLIFTVDEDVMPEDDTITVVEQEVDIEIGDNATIMLYQEHFESQAYTDNRRKYFFIGPLAAPTDRIYIPDWNLPDKAIVSTELIRKRMSVHLGSSKSIYLIPTWMGYDIDNGTNELVFNETIPAGEFVEVIYDGVRLEK